MVSPTAEERKDLKGYEDQILLNATAQYFEARDGISIFDEAASAHIHEELRHSVRDPLGPYLGNANRAVFYKGRPFLFLTRSSFSYLVHVLPPEFPIEELPSYDPSSGTQIALLAITGQCDPFCVPDDFPLPGN